MSEEELDTPLRSPGAHERLSKLVNSEGRLLVFASALAAFALAVWAAYAFSVQNDAALIGRARLDLFGAGRFGRFAVVMVSSALLATRSRRDSAALVGWSFALACLMKSLVGNSVHLLHSFYATVFIGGAFLRQLHPVALGIGLPLLGIVATNPFTTGNYSGRSDFVYVVMCAFACATVASVRDGSDYSSPSSDP